VPGPPARRLLGIAGAVVGLGGAAAVALFGVRARTPQVDPTPWAWAIEGRLREAMSKLGHGDAAIVRAGPPEERTYRISMLGSQEENRDLSVQVVNGLGENLGVELKVKTIDSIGPRVGKELRSSAFWAIVASWIGIMLYVWFRFEWQYAPGAVIVAWSEMANEPPPWPRCATLVVTGERSWLPVRMPRSANIAHVPVPGGHSVLWDDFDTTADAIVRFLEAS